VKRKKRTRGIDLSEHRCPLCGYLLFRDGEREAKADRVRCRGCGTWVFADSSVLLAPRKSCAVCGRPLRRLKGRCPACGTTLRRGFWRRLLRFALGRKAESGAFTFLPLARIHCRTIRPRRSVDSRSFRILLRSVEAYGILVPLLVRPKGGSFELVSGHRRFLAAYKLGFKEVPVVIRRLENEEVEKLRLLENVSQEPFHSLDVAEGVERVCLESTPAERREFLETLEIAERDLPSLLKPLSLPEVVKDALSLGLITEEEAEEIPPDLDAEAFVEHLRTRVAEFPVSPPREASEGKTETPEMTKAGMR